MSQYQRFNQRMIVYKQKIEDGTLRVKDIPLSVFDPNYIDESFSKSEKYLSISSKESLVEAALYSDPDAVGYIPDSFISPKLKLSYAYNASANEHLVSPPIGWKDIDNEKQAISNGKDIINEFGYPVKEAPPTHITPTAREVDSVDFDNDIYMDGSSLYNFIKSNISAERTYYKKEEIQLILPPEELCSGDHFCSVSYMDGKNPVKVKDVPIQSHHIYAKFVNEDAENKQEWSWVMPSEDVVSQFGQDVLKDLIEKGSVTAVRNVPVKAVEVTREMLDIYDGRNQDKVIIRVPWLSNDVAVLPGDYITEHGYSIRQEDMVNYKLEVTNDLENASSRPKQDRDSLTL